MGTQHGLGRAACTDLQHGHGHGYAAWTSKCWVSKFMSSWMSMLMLLVHIYAACSENAACPCPCCMLMSMLHFYAHSVCPHLCCMSVSMLHAQYTTCCVPMSMVHAACPSPCCTSMFMLYVHVHAAWPCVNVALVLYLQLTGFWISADHNTLIYLVANQLIFCSAAELSD